MKGNMNEEVGSSATASLPELRAAWRSKHSAYASASGLAEINEVVMFTSPATATTTHSLKGFVHTRP
jgi:hypothetical protein